MDLKTLIRDVPDFPKPGILFRDITPLLSAPEGLRAVVEPLAARYRDSGVTKIVAIESRGFIFGAALALELGIGFVPVRKKGKLPHVCRAETYDLEYGSDTVEIHADALNTGERVVIVDDVIATGGTLAAACRLVAALGAEVHEAACVIELTFLPGREQLGGVPFHALVEY